MAKTNNKNGGKTKTKTKTKTNKNKKKIRSLALDAMAMKVKSSPKPNAFETLWTRKKFDILGKKQKGQGRRVGLSRSQAVEKRKKTLLQEYKQSGKANTFLDRRFGENDDTLGVEDKAIIRFQRERQARILKKSKYTLEDGEDDILTHHGSALSTLDDFEDEIVEDEEDVAAELGDTITRKLNFGMSSNQDVIPNADVVGEDTKHKSKKEVMEEIIVKSKFYKAQKAKEKEEDIHLMEKLDTDFVALSKSKALLSLLRPHKERLKSLLSKGSSHGSKDESNSFLVKNPESEKDQPDDYDKLVKGMSHDIRVCASDRTKTPEEIAQEERDRLEKLEKERKKRMFDNEDSNDDEEDTNDSKRRVQKRMKMLSGDDLGDSFLSDDEPDKKGWVDEVLERKEEESESDDAASASEETGDGEDSTDTGERLVEQDWEQSNEELDHDDKIREAILDDLGAEVLQKKKKDNTEKEIQSPKSQKAKNKITTAQRTVSVHKTLPFVINAPSNLAELRSLLDNLSDDQIVEAIRRIRACNAISLAADNRRKMQVFYGVLLQYFAVLADERPLNLNKLNLLVRPLMEISSEIPYFAAICARKRLVHIRNQMSVDLRNSDKCSCWPSAKILLLVRLWSLVFPPSDFRHVVITPCVLLMSECLMRCPVNSGRDIAIGALLCSMVLSVTREARRFCPEAVKFLQALLKSSLTTKSLNKTVELKYQMPTFLWEQSGYGPWLHLSSKVSVLPPALDFMAIMDAGDNDPLFDSNNYRVGIINSATETLRGFANIYNDIASFPEVFASFVPLLYEVAKETRIPESLQIRMTGLAHLINEKIEEHEMLRQPLRMRLQKPVPIKQFNPRFEENFVQGRDYDPDRERAQRKKLQRQIKREAKGAARELRKDNYFLAEVKASDKALAEEERKEKYKKAMAFLQEQEHAFKSGQLGKGRKKRK